MDTLSISFLFYKKTQFNEDLILQLFVPVQYLSNRLKPFDPF